MIEGEDVADDVSGCGDFGEREGEGGIDGEGARERGEEFFSVGKGMFAGRGVGAEAGGFAPERLAVGAALDEERPARERFAGKMFAGGFEDDGAGKGGADQLVRETAGVGELGGAEGGGVPLGAGGRDGDEGGLAAHREEDAAACERGFDARATGEDFFPGGGGVGSGGHRRCSR